MFISKKILDKKLLEQKEHLQKSWAGQVKVRDERIQKLEKEISEARNLKEILDKLTIKWTTITSSGGIDNDVSWIGGTHFSLDESVLVYVDDYFGGKVIKQEATKLVIVDEKGDVTYSQTKQSPDKGFKYKLLRK